MICADNKTLKRYNYEFVDSELIKLWDDIEEVIISYEDFEQYFHIIKKL